MKQSNPTFLINLTLALLGLYNLFYWPAKLLVIMQDAYLAVRESFYMFSILEFMAVASCFVDVVVRWDRLGHTEKRVRILLTSLFTLLFLLRFGFGFMEHYLGGEVR